MGVTFEIQVRAVLARADWLLNNYAHHVPEPGEQVSDYRLRDLIEMSVETDDVVNTILSSIVSTGALLGTPLQQRFIEVARKHAHLMDLLLSLAARISDPHALDEPSPTVH